jgi:glycosyltransferase involved in cell wall biosynthesis
MRICLYSSTALPKRGGQEYVVDALARQFSTLGHQVVVLAPRPRRRLPPVDGTLGYPVVRHPPFYSTRYFVGWYQRYVRQLFRARPFDVLHVHGIYRTGYIGALAKSALGCPLILTSHGDDAFQKNRHLCRPLLAARYRLAVQSADALVAISRMTADGYKALGASPTRIVEIPNGVDAAALATSVEAPPHIPADLARQLKERGYVLFLGRLKNRKGVDVLLRALAAVTGSASPDLVVAGDGECRPELEALAGELGIRRRVHFAGWIGGADKAWWLGNALCLAVPSRGWESFGLVVLEAYAAGCPVIASNLAGLGDLVKPGETGWRVPPESTEALARAISEAAGDPQRARSMGEAARRVADSYSWRSIAERHLALYEELLFGARNARPRSPLPSVPAA